MKKIFLAIGPVLLAGFFVAAMANNSGNKTDRESRKQVRKEKREIRRQLWVHSVNSATENQFYSDFPDAKDVSWTEGNFSEASFRDGASVKKAYYDSDHSLVGTTTEVEYSALPARARQHIEQKYPGYTVEKIVLFDDNEANNTDMFLFGNSFREGDSYFPLLTKGEKQILLKVTRNGDVSFFQNYK